MVRVHSFREGGAEKVATARRLGLEVWVQWDGGVATRRFETVSDAMRSLDDLPAELDAETLVGDGYEVKERT